MFELSFHRCEQQIVRWLQRRISFFWTAALLTLGGLLAGLLGDNNMNWWKGMSYVFGYLLAFLGLVLAVYSIKAITDRPSNIKDVLLLAADILEEAPHKKRLITLICEYPAWGALSERGTTAYKRYIRNLEVVVLSEHETRVVVIAPCHQAQETHIDSYAAAYGTTSEATSAKDVNTTLLTKLLADRAHSRHWPVAPPRYQAIIISDLVEDNEPVHRKAVFWLAARSSENVEARPPSNPERRKHVPILGWQISDPDELTDLFESAVYFASQSAGRQLNTQQFMMGSNANAAPI